MSRTERNSGAQTPTATYKTVITPNAPKKSGLGDSYKWRQRRNTANYYYDTDEEELEFKSVTEEWSDHMDIDTKSVPKKNLEKTFPEKPWTKEVYSESFSSIRLEPDQNLLNVNKKYSTISKVARRNTAKTSCKDGRGTIVY